MDPQSRLNKKPSKYLFFFPRNVFFAQRSSACTSNILASRVTMTSFVAFSRSLISVSIIFHLQVWIITWLPFLLKCYD